MFPLVSEGKLGRMLTASSGVVIKEDSKDLGVGARGREQRMKTVRETGLNCSLVDTCGDPQGYR